MGQKLGSFRSLLNSTHKITPLHLSFNAVSVLHHETSKMHDFDFQCCAQVIKQGRLPPNALQAKPKHPKFTPCGWLKYGRRVWVLLIPSLWLGANPSWNKSHCGTHRLPPVPVCKVCKFVNKSDRFKFNFLNHFLFTLVWSFSVQHCFPIPWCRGRGTKSQALPWSILTVRPLSSTAFAPQVRCSNGANSDVYKILAN